MIYTSSCEALATVVSRVYFSSKKDAVNVSDVFGHLANSDNILMILKAMILSCNYCSDDLIVTAKEVLKELYDRYGE